jgi:hypothetical protein
LPISLNKTLPEKLLNMLIMLLLLMAAVSHNGRIFGYETARLIDRQEYQEVFLPPTPEQIHEAGFIGSVGREEKPGVWEIRTPDDSAQGKVIHSALFTKGLLGFAGPVPLYLYLGIDSSITAIQILENDETIDFMKSVKKEGIIDQWIGRPYQEALTLEPDAISGASVTCFAINQGIVRTLAAYVQSPPRGNHLDAVFSMKTILAILVLISGVVVALRRPKNAYFRMIQMVINFVVLGFYCGQFISLKALLSWVQNGIDPLQSIVFLIMLLLAVFLPLFLGKNGYYCAWVCPFGAAQELAGKMTRKKWSVRPALRKYLVRFRAILTLSLLVSLWLGVSMQIAEYEPFAAFLFRHASVPVIVLAVTAVVAAVFLPMPFCRYACPTGQILYWIQKL